MDVNDVSVVAAVIAAGAAVLAVWVQVRSTSFTMRVQISQQLEKDFYYDEQMIERRRRAATALLEGRFVYEVDEILNFLDTVGMHVRRGALDEEFAFHSFGRRMLCYWEFGRARVLEVRKTYPNTWNDIDYLVDVLRKRQRRRLGFFRRGEVHSEGDEAARWMPLLMREAEIVPPRLSLPSPVVAAYGR